jgi:membrane protease YdiL (CAAX protease family)
MNSFEPRHFALLALPLVLIPSAAFLFTSLSKRLGKEQGYLLGFLFYWIIWCLIVPLSLLGKDSFLALFADKTPLFSGQNWPAAVLFVVIALVSLIMYSKSFIKAPFALILVAIPAATINGLCEELLWRGMYVKVFPNNIWLAILFPAIGFALWHLAPQQVFSDKSKMAFVTSAFFLGLAYGWIAYKTGSAKWTAISHSLNGITALSGMVGPSILTLLRRQDE